MSTNIYDTLSHLVAWTAPPEHAVLSLYLDISARSGVEAAVDYARNAWPDAVAQASARSHSTHAAEALDALSEQVEVFLEQELEDIVQAARDKDYDGLAVFLCPEPQLRQIVQLRFGFEDQLLIGRDPFLRQLLYIAEEYERSVCALVGYPDADTALLCELHVGDVVQVHEVKASQRRDLSSELNAHVSRMIREDPQLHVILMGNAEARKAAEDVFSRDVLDRIIDRIEPVDEMGHAIGDSGQAVGPESEGFLRAMHRSLQAYERRAEAQGVARILALRSNPEKAAIGLPATLAAINKGKLKVLYILQDYEGYGWLCDACDTLGAHQPPPACTACGATVASVPLEEHILDQAAACGAEIDTVKDSVALAEIGGVGALLDDP
ncbi:MAG: hypothetical protein ACE366_03035 [Bradymonadia bacterium]